MINRQRIEEGFQGFWALEIEVGLSKVVLLEIDFHAWWRESHAVAAEVMSTRVKRIDVSGKSLFGDHYTASRVVFVLEQKFQNLSTNLPREMNQSAEAFAAFSSNSHADENHYSINFSQSYFLRLISSSHADGRRSNMAQKRYLLSNALQSA